MAPRGGTRVTEPRAPAARAPWRSARGADAQRLHRLGGSPAPSRRQPLRRGAFPARWRAAAACSDISTAVGELDRVAEGLLGAARGRPRRARRPRRAGRRARPSTACLPCSSARCARAASREAPRRAACRRARRATRGRCARPTKCVSARISCTLSRWLRRSGRASRCESVPRARAVRLRRDRPRSPRACLPVLDQEARLRPQRPSTRGCDGARPRRRRPRATPPSGGSREGSPPCRGRRAAPRRRAARRRGASTSRRSPRYTIA